MTSPNGHRRTIDGLRRLLEPPGRTAAGQAGDVMVGIRLRALARLAESDPSLLARPVTDADLLDDAGRVLPASERRHGDALLLGLDRWLAGRTDAQIAAALAAHTPKHARPRLAGELRARRDRITREDS